VSQESPLHPTPPGRRQFVTAAGATLATSLFSENVKGANGKVNLAFIGTGAMGTGNIASAMKHESVEIVAVCDVYQPHLKRGADATGFFQAKPVKDFREILADKSIDAVCISTPDHWHAYMTVEACKAGKDVYVEKPACTTIDEARIMVQAARKYGRVVQMGTMQRSGVHFQQATDLVRKGQLGKLTCCRGWNYMPLKPEGYGKPPDSTPPPTLDWDLWLGPAPLRPFNANRFGVAPRRFSTFRFFWDYAGGIMTDWGVHMLDIVQMGTGDVAPKSVTALGGRYFLQDNTETPDTLQVTYEYASGFLATYEYRAANAQPLFDRSYGTAFYGAQGTVFVDRSLCQVLPEKDSALEAQTTKASNDSHAAHWANFIDCIKSRQKPICDIETGARSTVMCLLANVALRSGRKLDWDEANWTTVQPEARPLLTRQYRAPWKLEL
jgi:predicted dehydrogenase